MQRILFFSFNLIIAMLLSLGLEGCGSDSKAADASNGVTLEVNETSGELDETLAEVNDTAFEFTVFEGLETDILHQTMEVIDTTDAYNRFLLSIPSMSREAPDFNEDNETLICVLSNAKSCIFAPVVTSVTESETTITVKILNKKDDTPDDVECDPIPIPFHVYNIVKIAKTSKPISLIIENDIAE